MRSHHLSAWLRPAALLLLLLLLLESSPARADDQRAILDLVVNHVEIGEVGVILREGDALVAREDLEQAGLVGITGRSERAFQRDLVSLASLSPPLVFAVDESALTLRIDAPARMLKGNVVSLSPSAPEDVEQRRDTSAFLNYALSAGYPFELGGALEAGLSVDGDLLQTSVSASSSRGAVRGLTSFTVDDRESLRRWVVGDSFVSGGALGGGLLIGGLQVSKTWSLDPYSTHTPSLGFAGAATAPSTLDVYVNGVLQKSLPIAPGPFQVDDLRAPSGSGEIRYVVRDAFGRQEVVASPYYASATVLRRGLSEYSYALGAQRRNAATESLSYEGLALLARHRYGLSDRITAGLRVEATPERFSFGPSATVVLPVGQLDAELAGSAAATGSGGAALLGYSYTSRLFGCGVMMRALSDGYSTLSLAPEDDRERVRLSAFTSVAIGARANLTAQYAFAIDRDRGASFQVGVSGNVQILTQLSLTLGLARSIDAQSGSSISASAGLTVALGSNLGASAGARQQGAAREAYAEINKPLPAGNGFAYRGYGVVSRAPAVTGTAQYQGPYGHYQATLRHGPGGPSGELAAAGGLVFVRGAGVLPTRPVQDGFAVIQVPGAPKVRGSLDNQEIGRTNGDGHLVVPSLLPYYGNRVSIADVDVPADRSVGAVERTIAPPYRGGALVRFEARRARFLRGKVRVLASDTVVLPSYGEIAVKGPAGETSSPLGADGEFELADLAPGRYAAQVVHGGGTCAFELRIPDSEEPVIKLGEQRCKASP